MIHGIDVSAQSATLGARGWRLEHSYAQLPNGLHASVRPTAVRAPRMVMWNGKLAEELGLGKVALAGAGGRSGAAEEIFSGNVLPPGAAPLAQAYAGHQYGHFTTLGDGRAILLGEQITPRGERFDVQLKGAGPTPYSRRGDGRATLGAMLREYVISEAMHALGIPTTRSLAVVATGEEVWRQDGARPGAVLTRVAASHLRVGTFEWVAVRRDEAAKKALVKYTLERHYPELMGAPYPARALLGAVIERQARLIAQWVGVGFVHGVMNTDNMALSGETIDYGPCAFMEAYDPATVFSSIDRDGRYAFGHQPQIAQWNIARFAETLLSELHPQPEQAIELATEAIGGFGHSFQRHWLARTRRKLGLFNEELEDVALIEALLTWMQAAKADFTNTFAELETLGATEAGRTSEFQDWHARWQARLARQPQTAEEALRLRRANCPAVIPRNHRVEEALAAAEQGDASVMERLLAVMASPFDHERARTADVAEYRVPAPDGGEGYRTFCGT
ncbi:MAG: YdiU family protein [Opitutaceae bacterium]|nr:YdiU family protein [Opitutaceae bacterium]